MKAEHRKELETNTLADKMGRMIAGAKEGPSRGMLFWVILAVVALAAVFLIYRYFATSADRLATQWYLFEDGSAERLQQVIKAGPSETPGKAARFQFAYQFLWFYGVKKLGGNPKDAFLAIDAAENQYAALAKECVGDPVFHPEALYGLAVVEETRAIENRDNLATALKKYEAVVESNKDSAFAELARKRIEALNDPAKRADIERFYQELQHHLNRRGHPQIPPELEKFLPPPGK